MPPAGKNKTTSVVYWFYNDVLGRPPDASLYARHQSRKNPRAIVHLIDSSDPMVASYTPDEIASLIWYLIDEGVKVDDLTVVAIPGLLYNFTNRFRGGSFASELEKTILWLRNKNAPQEQSKEEVTYARFDGWGAAESD